MPDPKTPEAAPDARRDARAEFEQMLADLPAVVSAKVHEALAGVSTARANAAAAASDTAVRAEIQRVRDALAGPAG